jgi:hypothetical protein
MDGMSNSMKNGLIAGGLAIIVSLVIYLISDQLYLSISPFAMFGIILFYMIMSIKQYKSSHEGLATFREAFKESWLTYFNYAVLTSFFAYLMLAVIDPNLVELTKEKGIEAMDMMKGYMGEEAYEKAVEAIENESMISLDKIFLNFGIRLLIPGAIIALIISLIMAKEKKVDWTA